ncbi:hypothetical protein ARMSODRAFT_806599 [Armillaria solidipes]|uniref:Uncharacterized protein n=1 Tax=Armillaria solidipes TaxID=1076256 RepID=A0A2H3AJX4_9AGAR|nr:hypothetical protein ARMSODRAFT_806599 [Armillaria solidipes]
MDAIESAPVSISFGGKLSRSHVLSEHPSTLPSSFFFLAPVDLEAEIFVRRESWMPRTSTLFTNLRIPPRSRFSKCWVCSLQYALPFGHHHGTRVLRSVDAQILESVEADLAESGPSITPKTNTLALVDDLPAPSNTEALPDPVCELHTHLCGKRFYLHS